MSESPFQGGEQSQTDPQKQREHEQGKVPTPEVRDERTGKRRKDKEED